MTPTPLGRKRLPKGTKIKRWTARTAIDVYQYLSRLADERGQELAYTLNQVLNEHKKFHEGQ